MPLKGLLDRAKKAAMDRLGLDPEADREAPRESDRVSGRDAEAEAAPARPDAAAQDAATRRRNDALKRVKTKADKGLKPEDRLVVVYMTEEQREDVDAIVQILEGVDTVVRVMDLDGERPQTRRQLAELTGVMVPPWVYINGKYWGTRYDMESLAAEGDLEAVIANRLDEIGEEARRIGGLHESYSDELTVDNIVARWKLGHILCVDDLDAWFEIDKSGKGTLYYMGGPRPAEDMRSVAEEIANAVEADEYEAHWQLEPTVHVG